MELPEFTVNQEKLLEANKFFLKLFATGIALRALIFISPDTYLVESVLAFLTGSLVQFFGSSTQIIGNRIVIENSIFVVSQDCLAWKSIAAFTGLSWASDIHRKDILIKGIAIISVLNMIRIVSTVLLASKKVISFEIIHSLLWAWGLTFAVLIIWIYWFRSVEN